MNRMLINATQEEELRMAMVDGQRLFDLNIELPASERKKANIYKGQITRIEPSLEAAFVNYGAERHGFLPLKEISSEYFVNDVQGGKPNIREVLKEGQDIVVQIDKEERGNKGAALTTYVSLAGRFIVLKPNKARSGGVSRRITGEDRDLARQSLKGVEVPDGMSIILRTAGIDRSEEEISWDLENLLSVWEAIKKVVVEGPSPFLIYRESNAVVRALRDYLTNDIGEILIDDEATYTEAREFVEQVMPHNLRKLKHYTDSVPLFTRYQIESQIESAFAHSVTLPSGGSLVIDHTEALVSVDINSARATKGGDIEATALNTNLEAADEVARQLRLRDLGGLVVIDFIDMGPQKNQREVENRLREAVRQDRARVQIGKISRFGLLEMSRQRLRPSLGESSYLVCPRCSGIGNIRSVESLALAILRLIGEEARKERTAKVIAQLPVEVATYLLNEKRDWVQGLESRHGTQVILVANPLLETPHYLVRRVRDDQVDLPENTGISYTLAEADDEPEVAQAMKDKKPAEVAAITTVVATTPAPPRPEPVQSTPGLFKRIATFFMGSDDGGEDDRKTRSRKSSDDKRGGARKVRKQADDRRQKKSRDSRQGKTQGGRKQGAKKSATRDTDPSDQPKRTQKAARKNKAEQDARDDNRPSSGRRRSRGGRRRRKSGNGNDAGESAQQAAAGSGRKDAPAQAADDSGRRAEDRPQKEDRPTASRENRQPDSSGNASAPKVESSAGAPGVEPAPRKDADQAQASPPRELKPTGQQPPAPAENGSGASGMPSTADEKPHAPKDTAAPRPKEPPKPAAKEPTPEQPVEPAPERVAKKPEPPPQQSPAGNGDDKPAGPASGNGADDGKQAGRLLPWEPPAPSGESSADKDR